MSMIQAFRACCESISASSSIQDTRILSAIGSTAPCHGRRDTEHFRRIQSKKKKRKTRLTSSVAISKTFPTAQKLLTRREGPLFTSSVRCQGAVGCVFEPQAASRTSHRLRGWREPLNSGVVLLVTRSLVAYSSRSCGLAASVCSTTAPAADVHFAQGPRPLYDSWQTPCYLSSSSLQGLKILILTDSLLRI